MGEFPRLLGSSDRGWLHQYVTHERLHLSLLTHAASFQELDDVEAQAVSNRVRSLSGRQPENRLTEQARQFGRAPPTQIASLERGRRRRVLDRHLREVRPVLELRDDVFRGGGRPGYGVFGSAALDRQEDVSDAVLVGGQLAKRWRGHQIVQVLIGDRDAATNHRLLQALQLHLLS